MSSLPTVEELTERSLDKLIARIHENYKKSALSLIDIGRDLNQAKALVPHGEWANWLDTNFGLSQSSAHNFMRVAKQFGKDPEILNGCDFGSRVLYALAAPSTPDVAVDVAIYEARSEQSVGVERVAEVKAQAKSGGDAGVYFGEDVASLTDGDVVLEAGDPVELTGISFASNPQLVYVRKGGVTFLVDRDDVDAAPSTPTVDDRQYSLFADPVEAPLSVEEESDRRAESLGLSTSRVQVLPDVDRREAPGDVDDRPFAAPPVRRLVMKHLISVVGPGNIEATVSLLHDQGWHFVDVLDSKEVGDAS